MASLGFPLSFIRLGAEPLDVSEVFKTTQERMDYLTNGTRYAGMIVYDYEADKHYRLSKNKNSWQELQGSGSSATIGNWTSATEYNVGDFVVHKATDLYGDDGTGIQVLLKTYYPCLYRCKIAHTSTTNFNDDIANWESIDGSDFTSYTQSELESMLGLTPTQIQGLQQLINDTTVETNHTWSSSQIYTKMLDTLLQAKTYTDNTLASSTKIDKKIVTVLPAVADADPNTMYLIKDSSVTTEDVYLQYMLIDNELKSLGRTNSSTSIKIFDATKTYAHNDLVLYRANSNSGYNIYICINSNGVTANTGWIDSDWETTNGQGNNVYKSDIVDNLNSPIVDKPLSANQGYELKKLIDNKLGKLDGTIMVSNTFENVLANTEYKFDSPVSLNGVYSSSMYKLQSGSSNLSNNLKEFNDTTSKDFIKNTDDVVIDNNGARIIDSAKLTPSYNNETGFYELTNPNFTDITNINVVNNTMTLSDTDKGNYVTLNADKLSGAITYGYNFVRGTKYFNKGKWYWEVTNLSTSGGNCRFSCGIANSTLSNVNSSGYCGTWANGIVSGSGNGYTFSVWNGKIGDAQYNSEQSYSTTSAVAHGSIISILLDLDNDTIEFWVNGAITGGTYPIIHDSYTIAIFSDSSYGGNTPFKINAGQAPFAYTPPSNFKSFNTKQFLLEDNGVYKTYDTNTNSLINVSDAEAAFANKTAIEDETKILPYISQLSNNWKIVSNAKLEVMIYGSKTKKSMIGTIESISMKAYKTIKSITGNYSIDGSNDIKFAFSFDNGTTWKSYDSTNSWKTLTIHIPLKTYASFDVADLANWNNAISVIETDGTSVQTLSTVDFQSQKTDNLMFVALFSKPTPAFDCTLNSLVINYDGAMEYIQLAIGNDLTKFEGSMKISGDSVTVKSATNCDKLLVSLVTNV